MSKNGKRLENMFYKDILAEILNGIIPLYKNEIISRAFHNQYLLEGFHPDFFTRVVGRRNDVEVQLTSG